VNKPPEPPADDADRIQRALAAAPGEPVAAAELLPLIYEELRTLARSRMAQLAPGQTLQATALVHEAWMRVVGEEDPGWECRAHFFGAASRAMRNILVDQYRRKDRVKHGGDRTRLPGEELVSIEAPTPTTNYDALDAALDRLEREDELKAKIVMLRFFTGMSMPRVAEVLGLPLTRVEREWRFGRAWLQRDIEGGTAEEVDG
jgi:RNA polymerase sigma factor (TIGR02999 family)